MLHIRFVHLAVVGLLCLAAYVVEVAALVAFASGDDAADVEPAASGRPFPRAFTVDSTAVVTLELSSTAVTSFARCVVTTSATPLFLVEPGAATTASGEGPYCVGCAGGSVVIVPSAKGFARTSSGSADVRCSFFDGPASVVGLGGGGGGVSASLVCLLTGGVDCQLPTVRGSTFGFQDTNGVVDVQVSTSPAASGGGIVQIVDPRSTLAATACDATSELGQIVLYTDGASSSDSICVCERIAGAIAWNPVSVAGDCT